MPRLHYTRLIPRSGQQINEPLGVADSLPAGRESFAGRLVRDDGTDADLSEGCDHVGLNRWFRLPKRLFHLPWEFGDDPHASQPGPARRTLAIADHGHLVPRLHAQLVQPLSSPSATFQF